MRTFIAIDLPEAIRAALAREQGRLRATCESSSDIRWTRPEGLHLTLKFLGELGPANVGKVTEALDPLGKFEPFEIDVGGFGFFPSVRRPRVFWVGLSAPAALAELAGRVEAAMEPLGFARENRPYQPHLTLARIESQRPQPALESALQKAGSAHFGKFTAADFFLFESKLKRGGSEYSKLARFERRSARDEGA